MKKIKQVILWCWKFSRRVSRDRVDAYAAQSAFFYHHGFYSVPHDAAFYAAVYPPDVAPGDGDDNGFYAGVVQRLSSGYRV